MAALSLSTTDWMVVSAGTASVATTITLAACTVQLAALASRPAALAILLQRVVSIAAGKSLTVPATVSVTTAWACEEDATGGGGSGGDVAMDGIVGSGEGKGGHGGRGGSGTGGAEGGGGGVCG